MDKIEKESAGVVTEEVNDSATEQKVEQTMEQSEQKAEQTTDQSEQKAEQSEQKDTKMPVVYKKSELLKKLAPIEDDFDKKSKSIGMKEYRIQIGVKKEDGNFDKRHYYNVVDFLKKRASWKYQTVVPLMMLTEDLVKQKSWVDSKDFDGYVTLKAGEVGTLYRALQETEGKGYYVAKTFFTFYTIASTSLDAAIKDINSGTKELRELSQNMVEIEQELEKAENDLPEGETNETFIQKLKNLQDEVDPIVQA